MDGTTPKAAESGNEKIRWSDVDMSLSHFKYALASCPSGTDMRSDRVQRIGLPEDKEGRTRNGIVKCVVALPSGQLTINSFETVSGNRDQTCYENIDFIFVKNGSEIRFRSETNPGIWSIKLDGTELDNEDRKTFMPELKKIVDTLNAEWNDKLVAAERAEEDSRNQTAAQRTAELREKMSKLF